MKPTRAFGLAVGALVILGGCDSVSGRVDGRPKSPGDDAAAEVPTFQFDPTWPKMPLPDNWIVSSVIGVAVDERDHIWILHRPSVLTVDEKAAALNPPEADCCRPAPPVIEFDQAGNVVQAWGGSAPASPWPLSEHGIFVDHHDHVWVGSPNDSQLLKFSRDGKFLLQIGQAGVKKRDSNDTTSLGGPMGVVDAKTNELYVADGYRNRRVIVFDADTGMYKRHWGAYGNRPDDSVEFNDGQNPWRGPEAIKPDGHRPQQFNTVTCVRVNKLDELVYVCDRANNRIQVFKKDGTFVKEGIVAPRALKGSVAALDFSQDPEQRFVYVADPRNNKIWILRRSDLEVVGSFGHAGHFAGGFTKSAYVAADSKGNLYVGEGSEGKRVQRFLYKGRGRSLSN